MSSERKSLVRKLDTAFSLYIRERDGHCVTCGSKERLQCGHLFTRAAYSTRWNSMNAYCQCSSCNMRHEYDPGPLTIYFLAHYGQAAYEALHRKHKTPVKYSDGELLALIEKYKGGEDGSR